MTTKTRAQLVNEAADCLEIVPTGNSLAAEDGAKIDEKVDSLLERLAADEVVDIADANEIPACYFDALGELLANNCATKFGKKYSEEVKTVFERQLRRTVAPRATLEVLRTEYF